MVLPPGVSGRVGAALLVVAALLAVLGLGVGVVVAGIEADRNLALFGTVTGAAVGAFLLGGLALGRVARRVPPRSILLLDATRLPTARAQAPLARLLGRKGALDLVEIVRALDRGARDPAVAGCVVRAGVERGGLAQVQEVRAALARLREAGKFVVAFADTFGDLSGGAPGYYLASACDQIVLQPGGMLGLVGLVREADFVAGTLRRLGVEAIVEGRHEYKSAAHRLVNDHFSDPERAQEQRLVDSQLDQIVRGIAQGRTMTAEEVRALIERGPFLAREAVDVGLVDGLAHFDEVEQRVKERAGRGADLLPLPAYARRRRPGRRGTTVALLHATGSIARRAGAPLPVGGSLDAGALAEALGRAAASRRVRAILLRVDSPGGDAVASETLHRAVARASAEGTPVVVSMGNVAASGAYYLAVAADRIVAQPATLTGSIGVFSGKLVVTGLKARAGVTTDEIHAGRRALIASANRVFDEEERERFGASLDAIYATFVERVAKGRKMTAAQVDTVARGRVFTGEDALGVGLVDRLGGIHEALEEVRGLLDLAPGAPLRLEAQRAGLNWRGRLRAAAIGAETLRESLARVAGLDAPRRLERDVGRGL